MSARPRRPSQSASITSNGSYNGGFTTESSAKYIQGTLSMLRSQKMISTQRNGVMVINIEEGGSLSFYKVFRAASHFGKKNSEGSAYQVGSIALGDSASSNAFRRSLMRNISDLDNNPSPTPAPETSSIFLRADKSRRNVMQVDDETKARIEKVSVYVSSSSFREPMEMPYLRIPACVPWIFKSINKYKNQYFQIVVPPLPNGELDTRVKFMSIADKFKKFMQVTTVVDGKLITFGTIMGNNTQIMDDCAKNEFDHSDRGGGDDLNDISLAGTTISLKQSKRNTQIFTFKCPNTRDLAIYATTAMTLNRMYIDNKIKRTTTLFSSKNKRIRTAESMEIRLQTELLDRNIDSGEMASKQYTLGSKEYRCVPLHAYPYSWMTDLELVEEMERESRVWCDLRGDEGDEMGYFKIEVLSCSGLPKMDAYSDSDPMVYVVCGSSAFVTDVIDDKLDAYWLPLSRRACILPIANPYAQVFVGVFDYDGEKEMDDFIGRVVVDISRIQAGCTYDVKLPLRDCSKVYNRNQLGCIRLRFRLEWNGDGERAALLSYLPSVTGLMKRMKNDLNPVTVKCPDSKSFYNIAHTVYGKDIPGKYSNSIRNATTKELTLFNKMLVFSVKDTMKTISDWKHPLLSGYIFFWWMHFVIANSLALFPAFIMSLVVILLLRNYIKYYLKSSSSLLYGQMTIFDMIRILLFKKFTPYRMEHSRRQWRQEDRPFLEVLFLKTFGMSTKPLDPEKMWRIENHSEFPFSNGTVYPKITNFELSEDNIWNDDENEDVDEEFENMNEEDEAFKMNLKSLQLAKRGGKLVEGQLWKTPTMPKARRHSVILSHDNDASSTDESPALFGSILRRWKTAANTDVDTVLSADPNPSTALSRSATDYPGSPNSSLRPSLKTAASKIKVARLTTGSSKPDKVGWLSQQRIGRDNKFPPIPLPEQNVKAKKSKKSKPIQEEISEIHEKAHKATFHLFDDRVFVVDGDKIDGNRALMLHNSLNPALKVMNPILGEVFQILDTALNAFRAIFNILMWKDPRLSFWATIFVICCMYILFVFPWRLFFFVVGLKELGPQNYFLADWYKRKREAKKKRKEQLQKEKAESSPPQTQPVDLSKSPLLMRNNTQMRADGKYRGIIVPSVPLRYNRFYDWPPDPSTTVISNND